MTRIVLAKKPTKFIDPFLHLELVNKRKAKKMFVNPFHKPIQPLNRRPIVNPPKSLTYPQARRKYGISLSPFGDWDKDGFINMIDCRPFNPLKHRVPEEYKNRIVKSYFKPLRTWADIWKEAEEKIPHAFKTPGEEDYNSRLLSRALLRRESTFKQVRETPFKDVVGVYTIKNVPIGTEQTAIVQYYLSKYLRSIHPNKIFKFSDTDPSKVSVIDIDTHEARENIRVSRYIPKNAPAYVKNLLTLLTPYSDITVVITDDPVDILRKSSILKRLDQNYEKYLKKHFAWLSCETLSRNMIYEKESDTTPLNVYYYHHGPFSDIENCNAIAYFYKGKEPKGIPIGRVMLRWGTTHGYFTHVDSDKDIGIEFYPGKKEIPEYYHSKYGWRSDSNARGFYGAFTADMAKSLIGILQDILRKKGYYTKVVTTPYVYEGYSDLHREGNTTITYAPIKRRLENKKPTIEETMILAKGLVKRDKIPKPLLYAIEAHERDTSVRMALSSRQLPPDLQRKLSLDSDYRVVENLARNKYLTDKEAIKNIINYRNFVFPLATLIVEQPEKVIPEFKKEIFSRLESDISLTKEVLGRYAFGEKPEHKEIIKFLLSSKDPSIRSAVVKNGYLTEKDIDEIISYFEKHPHDFDSINAMHELMYYHHDNLTSRQIRRILNFFKKTGEFKSNCMYTVKKILYCRNTTPSIIERLIKFPCITSSYENKMDFLRIICKDYPRRLSKKIIDFIVDNFKPEEYLPYISTLADKPLSDKALEKLINAVKLASSSPSIHCPISQLEFYNTLYHNHFLTRKQKAMTVKSYIKSRIDTINPYILAEFLDIPEFYSFVKQNIKRNKFLRRAVSKISSYDIRNIPQHKLYDLFLEVYKYGNKENKRELYKNPLVNDELKKIIKNEGISYY